MKRRTFIATAVTAVSVGVAGCGSDMPDSQCEGHCEMLEEWTWDWDENGSFNPETLQINFIPVENSPTLEIEFRGYRRTSGEPNLTYANTYTINGPKTIIEEGLEPIHAAKIDVEVTE